MNRLPRDVRVRAISVLAEGASVRATERIVGPHKNTLLRLLVEIGEGCARLHDTLVRDLTSDILELDEVWNYVYQKEGRKSDDAPPEWGDAYTFLALDAVSRLIASWRVDRRTPEATLAFVSDLRTRVLGRPQITTDGFIPYVDAIEQAFGTRVHYAQVLKTYRADEAGGASRDEVRYGRGRVLRCVKRPIVGAPDPDHISTSLVERQNWTLRGQQRRFTRLSNGFSRKVENLRAAVALYAAHYNFVKVHTTLRITPAMAAGLTDHIWSVDELVARAETLAAPPARATPRAAQLRLPGVS